MCSNKQIPMYITSDINTCDSFPSILRTESQENSFTLKKSTFDQAVRLM